MKNNFLSKVLLLLLLIQTGFLVYQNNIVNIKNKYIQSRSNELKDENDKWLNFVTNSIFFLTENDSKRRDDLLYALSELDYKKENTPPNTIELYHNRKHINPQILSLLSSQYIKQNNSCWNLLSYKVFKDIYSQQYFVGNNTYHFKSLESYNYESYTLMVNGKKLTWNNEHSYVIPKSDSLDIKLNRIFLDFETGNLSSNTSVRHIRI
jgi:hypothetical protein